MKKHLFLVASVFSAVSLYAQTATMRVMSDAGVLVTPETLMYVNGKIKVDDRPESSNKKVINKGNVKITKYLESMGDNANFVNEYVGTAQYGQLIINSNEKNIEQNANVGKMSSGLKFKTGFVFYPIAIPYKGIKAKDVVTDLLGEEAVAKSFKGYNGESTYRRGFDKNRIPGNALYFWDNKEYLLDHLLEDYNIGQKGEEARYYAVNNSTNSKAGRLVLSNVTHVKGTPVKDNVKVILKEYNVLRNVNPRKGKNEAADITDNRNIGVNKYGEAYGSYIIDFTVASPTDWGKYYTKGEGVTINNDFGLRVYNMGNPYTSNINLAVGKDGINSEFWEKVNTIVQYGKQEYDVEINNSKASGSYGNKFEGLTKDNTGDSHLSFVAPFQTFAVKMNKGFKSDKDDGEITFTFTNEMKTFDGPLGSTGELVNTVFAKSAKQRGVEVNQVGLDLLDANKNTTGARTYVVASDIYEAAQKGEGTEIYNISMGNDDIGIYTLQENEDGTINERLSNNKSYINGVNADKYIAKPIHLVFQNGQGQYTLKARLNENLKKNKNTFYFEDKETGKVMKVTENFEYTFNIEGTKKDRFVLYWAATPNKEKEEVVAEQEVNTTMVFKDSDTYKIRFDKGINKADIFVYNISGQLVNTAKNIDTSVDYIVPLKGNSSVYIVKVVGDNGQITTKKVIK